MKILYILMMMLGCSFSSLAVGVADGTGKVLKAGDVASGFKFLSVTGKKVALEDFKGKYVYIDVWATWCGPCRKEIPHLKELEKVFRKKKIVFVSISTDTNLREWETMVGEEQLKGVQLNIDGDNRFKNAFNIESIPRFILLDKKGKVVNENMTRPSNPETEEFLRSLKGL